VGRAAETKAPSRNLSRLCLSSHLTRPPPSDLPYPVLPTSFRLISTGGFITLVSLSIERTSSMPITRSHAPWNPTLTSSRCPSSAAGCLRLQQRDPPGPATSSRSGSPHESKSLNSHPHLSPLAWPTSLRRTHYRRSLRQPQRT
jgi:hypothetical protein